MKTELFLKVKKDVYNFLKENADENGQYGSMQKELAKNINANSGYVTLALRELEKEKKIKTVQKYVPYTSNFIWEVVDFTRIHTGKEILDEIKKEKQDIINLDNYIIESFDNINLKIYNTKKGLAMSIIDISNVLTTSRQSIHQLLDYNKELFEPFLVKENIDNKGLNGERLFLTRDGLIGLLMKISYNKLSDEKKKLVLNFQKWAIEKLSILVSKGKVELTDMEQAKIQDNIKETLELKEEDIDKLFNDLELEVTNKINNMKSVVKKYKDESEIIKMNNQSLREINNKYRVKTIALQDRIRDLK